jgi:hypothetical protein
LDWSFVNIAEHNSPGIIVLLSIVLIFSAPGLADQVVAITPIEDAFVRQSDPSSDFGAAGLLCAAGADSVNGVGQPRGRFDSLLQFDMSGPVLAFDTAYGAGNWDISQIVLQVAQVAAPENAFFPRGIGDFDVFWLSEDSWSEGAGTPNAPIPGTGDQLTWNTLEALLTSGSETLLGTFANMGVDGTNQYGLVPQMAITSDMKSGGIVTLHVSPRSSNLGFTFHSKDFGDPLGHPQLIVSAIPILDGDLNCDGLVDVQDIPAFVSSLLDPGGYTTAHPGCNIVRADMNHDGFEDGRDIGEFIGAILGD